MDPLDVRTIHATIGALTLQVKAFQEKTPSNSLQNVHLNLLHLQLELTNTLTVQDRNTLFNCSIDATKLKSFSDRLTNLHRLFDEQKGQIENSIATQLRKEFTTTNDQLRKEIEHLKAVKEGLEQRVQSAETSNKKLEAELKSSYALVQSKEECVEEAHTIRRLLERDAVVSKEQNERLQQVCQSCEQEKIQWEEVNQDLKKDNTRLKQVNQQYQEKKLLLESVHVECEKKIQTLHLRLIENTSTELNRLREQNVKLRAEVDTKGGNVRLLERSNDLLQGDSENFQTELKGLKKSSTEKITGLEKELKVERNVRSELEKSKAAVEQQINNHQLEQCTRRIVDQEEQLRKVRESRNTYHRSTLALKNEANALKREAALDKMNENALNDRIRQLLEAAGIAQDELATERINMFELSKDNVELNGTVLEMKQDLGSLAEKWGMSVSNKNNIQTTPVTPSRQPQSSMSNLTKSNIQTTPVPGTRGAPSMLVSGNSNNSQTTPATPSRRQSSMSSSSKNNIQATPATQSRQQPSMLENNNSNNATPTRRKRSSSVTAPVQRPPRPLTDQERAHVNLDKLPLQLLKDFNEAWSKAETMVPGEGFHLVGPFLRRNPVRGSGA